MLPSQTSNPIQKSAWHKKAKWMLKKVLINTPTTENQMRDLCTDIIQREYGNEARSTAVVNTAIQMWDDPALKGALHNNQTFINARERIQNVSKHILPSSPSKGKQEEVLERDEEEEREEKRKSNSRRSSSSSYSSQVLFDSAHDVMSCAFNAALQCPNCGRNVHCLHEEPMVSIDEALGGPYMDINDYEEDEFLDLKKLDDSPSSDQESGEKKSTEEENEEDQTVAIAPRKKSLLYEVECTNEHDVRANFNSWFGPLVLASLAVVGLAVGVFNGEILMPRVGSLTARSIAAISMLLRASRSVFLILDR